MFRRKDNTVHRVLLQLRWKSSMRIEKTRCRSKKIWIVSYLCWKYVTPPPFWYFPKFLQEWALLFKLGKSFSQSKWQNLFFPRFSWAQIQRTLLILWDGWWWGGRMLSQCRTELKSTGVRRHSNEVFPAIKTPWAEQPHRPQLQRWGKGWHILW